MAETKKHYENAEWDATRNAESYHDGRGIDTDADAPTEVVTGDFYPLPVTVGMSEAEGSESRDRIDAFYKRLAEWKKENKVRGKIEDTLQGMALLGESEPTKQVLGTVLGIDKGSARDRLKSIRKHLPAIRQIAREVGLGV